MKPLDLVGQRFGKLVPFRRVPDPHLADHLFDFSRVSSYFECQCDCGNITTKKGVDLRTGNTRSCGCAHWVVGKQRHDWKGHEEIPGQFWRRVTRGAINRNLMMAVTIEQAWDKFIEQDRKCALSGVPITFKGHLKRVSGNRNARTNQNTASLDRIDSTQGYEPGNIQWVHKTVQLMKWAYPQTKFLEWIRVIAKHQGFTQTSN